MIDAYDLHPGWPVPASWPRGVTTIPPWQGAAMDRLIECRRRTLAASRERQANPQKRDARGRFR